MTSALELAGRDAAAAILAEFGEALASTPERAALAARIGSMLALEAAAGRKARVEHLEGVLLYLATGAADEAREKAARTAARLLWGVGTTLASLVSHLTSDALAGLAAELGRAAGGAARR